MTKVLLGLCIRVDDRVGARLMCEWLFGNVMVMDCCVRVSDAGISRLNFCCAFESERSLILRFKIRASEASKFYQSNALSWTVFPTFPWRSQIRIVSRARV